VLQDANREGNSIVSAGFFEFAAAAPDRRERFHTHLSTARRPPHSYVEKRPDRRSSAIAHEDIFSNNFAMFFGGV
jgi:hypothetical protein